MTDIRKLIGEALGEIASDARSGGPRISVGLMAAGSELGPEELAYGARLAMENMPRLEAVMIGPRVKGFGTCHGSRPPTAKGRGPRHGRPGRGRIAGAVAPHYPSPWEWPPSAEC